MIDVDGRQPAAASVVPAWAPRFVTKHAISQRPPLAGEIPLAPGRIGARRRVRGAEPTVDLDAAPWTQADPHDGAVAVSPVARSGNPWRPFRFRAPRARRTPLADNTVRRSAIVVRISRAADSCLTRSASRVSIRRLTSAVVGVVGSIIAPEVDGC